MPTPIPETYFEHEPESILKCRRLNQSILEALGGKLFGSYFGIKACSTVSYWIERGTGPLMWFRNLLIGVEKEGHSLALVKQILNYLAKPFELICISRARRSISYVSIIKEMTESTQDCALVQRIFAEIAEDGVLTLEELKRLRETVSYDVECIMRLEYQCDVLIQKAVELGGNVPVENVFRITS